MAGLFCFGSSDWYECAEIEPLCDKFEECKEKWMHDSFDWMKHGYADEVVMIYEDN